MKVAFTICSNNYLAKAKVVSDTFIANHPEYKFYFFLVDKLDDNLNYENFKNYDIIEIHNVVPNIMELAMKYNIIELNTAVKPSIFLYLFKKNNCELAIFLDPDVMIFDTFTEVEEAFSKKDNNIVVTPHFCSQIDDGKYPSEIDFAPFGLYNLGFIAVKYGDESLRFIEWWHERLMQYCYIKPERGMFTDQLWVNYAPVLFNGVFILKHLGYNVANWNLYERLITGTQSDFSINDLYKLKFFHFSHYDSKQPTIISKYQNRFSLSERPDLKMLFDNYQSKLIQNKQEEFSKSVCYYHEIYLNHQDTLKQKPNFKNSFKRTIIINLKKILK